jgi:hypothetical protein
MTIGGKKIGPEQCKISVEAGKLVLNFIQPLTVPAGKQIYLRIG